MTNIYYFSGTGNSLWSAKKIAQTAGDNFELYNIGAVEQAAVNEKEINIHDKPFFFFYFMVIFFRSVLGL